MSLALAHFSGTPRDLITPDESMHLWAELPFWAACCVVCVCCLSGQLRVVRVFAVSLEPRTHGAAIVMHTRRCDRHAVA